MFRLIPLAALSAIQKFVACTIFLVAGFVLGDAWCHQQEIWRVHAMAPAPQNIEIADPRLPYTINQSEYRLATDNSTLLPDPDRTPGAIRLSDAKTICTVKWGADRRHVTEKMKQEVCSDYGVAPGDCNGKNYEIDHLIPRELGGADDVRNLWPQPRGGRPGPRQGEPGAGIDQARMKDRLENALHKEVCAPTALEQIRLAISQKTIAENWYAAYLARFGASK